MRTATLFGVLFVASILVHEEVWSQNSWTCPKTLPPGLKMAGQPLPSTDNWYGSEPLAVALKPDGIWKGLGPEHNYRDKLAWWSYRYDGGQEPKPELVVTGERLDAEAAPAQVSEVTNAYVGGWVMLHLIEFPSSGCWEIKGTYHGQTLSFVVEVGQGPE